MNKHISSSAVWLICIIASIGFAFDIYELLMLPLIVRPALAEIAGYAPGTDEFKLWLGLLFYVPAFCGGIFGLLGGYLTDRFGRRRVLTWSILLYAFSAFAAGFSTNLSMLLFFRTTTFIGVCVEFVAAVAWLAELFDDPKQRERVLGYTQAFSSIGGLLVAIVNAILIEWAKTKSLYPISSPAWLNSTLPDSINIFAGQIKDSHAAWRYTLMSGLIPAIPLILIRPFLPESPKWMEKKAAGTLKRPRVVDLFSPELRRTTLLTTAMFACSYGAAFGAIQQMPQIIGGVDAVQTQISSATAEKEPKDVKRITGSLEQAKAAEYTKSQEVGGLVGRFLLALLVTLSITRASLLRIFLLPGLFLLPFIFYQFALGKETTYASINISFIPGFHDLSFSYLGLGIFLAGLFTVAQFSFWGNYLPGVFPLHLRGTGESFAANVGGRMIGTSFAAVTLFLADTSLVKSFVDASTSYPNRVAYAAAAIAGLLYLVNLVLSFFLPEPTPEV